MWIIWTALGLCAAALCAAALWQGLRVRRYTVRSAKLSGRVKLLLLSDLHGTRYGREQERLVRAVEGENPDLVLLAGDMADDKVPNQGTLELLRRIGRAYPCFFAPGNHENRTGNLEAVKEMFRSHGVCVLDGRNASLEAGGQRLLLAGVDDPETFGVRRHERYTAPPEWLRQLDACRPGLSDSRFSILVSHRPELVGEYEESGFDLVVSGHAHGGQVRVPGLLNGLFAPSQGLFPRYAGGLYSLGKTTLVVSRGLCRNYLPRVFNPPEAVVVSLEPESSQGQ